MSFLDKLKDGVTKVLPDKGAPVSTSMSGGIGNGRGAVGFDDDMIVSKKAIVFHTSQVFFNFLAMCCFASVAAFQAKFHVGPSGLTGFALFVSITGIFLALFLMLVPVVYEKYDKLTRLARALKEVRVSFILTGTGVTFSLLLAFITTISAWTQPGCKDASKDPNADKGDSFKNGLPSWCSTKKAGAIFFWLAFAFWAASFVLAVFDWRSGKSSRPRDPPFHPPADEDYGDEESAYEIVPAARKATTDESNSLESPFSDNNRYSGSTAVVPEVGYTNPNKYTASPTAAQPRPSIDAYGAFSDPAPTGFGSPNPPPALQPNLPPPTSEDPRMSRTMQYADPYAAVRATVASTATPPSYTSYQGYR
ncbi:hypothetical protein DENSPDRAFT_832379 [Dentipellis sp. KUC8613]|nr:hypothetical protein DENSPDRAFT_832379 [Dentipellis sp. KUC8613]